jgi:hypothetical protein
MMRVWAAVVLSTSSGLLLRPFSDTATVAHAHRPDTAGRAKRSLDSLARVLRAENDSTRSHAARRIDSLAQETHQILVASETHTSTDAYALCATFLTLGATCVLAYFAWHHSQAARALVNTIETLGKNQSQASADEKNRRRRVLQRRVSETLAVVEQFKTLPDPMAPTPPWTDRLFDFIQEAIPEFGDEATVLADSARQLLVDLSEEWIADQKYWAKNPGAYPPNFTANWAVKHGRTVDRLLELQRALAD